MAGVDTQRVFDHVLTNLARSAPPIPGFGRTKGGICSMYLDRIMHFPLPVLAEFYPFCFILRFFHLHKKEKVKNSNILAFFFY